MASDVPPNDAGSAPVHFDRRILRLSAAIAAPAALLAGTLLWTGGLFGLSVKIALSLAVVAATMVSVLALRATVTRPLQTIANMAAALREGDFSARARGASTDDSLGFALLELNRLGTVLHDQRLSALDASALARAVMRETDVAVFVFDAGEILRLINPAGERLIGRPSERAIGRSAAALNIEQCLSAEPDSTLHAAFASGGSRWQIRRSDFRQGGRPHQLVVLADLSRALRDEERMAWQRLIRVLGHEINNSLAPIHSIATTLTERIVATERDDEWEQDLNSGLSVIAGRSAALARFMASYTLLARLPAPVYAAVDIGAWVHRVAHMEMRVPVDVVDGPPVLIDADPDQLDQLLINIMRNAADASLECGGGVTVGWSADTSFVDVWVRDEGPGLPETANLFVPFFTTKPGGSGIGLVLSRQIAEAHGGTLTLTDGHGCEARVRLPRA